MQFLNPTWLWGLTGLLIPIAIHLLSRKEGKVIRIGSIRYLEETSTRQFKNIRLNEWVLLVLRCLLITLLVLFLSGLSFTSTNTKEVNYLVLEKGMEHERDFKPLIDSLEEKGFEARWLAKDFPLLKDSTAILSHPNYWSLIESLKKEQVQQVVVLSYNYANNFKGKRTEMPDNVHWIPKNHEPNEFVLTVTRLAGDSVLVRKGNTSAEGTSFTNNKIRTESLPQQEQSLIQNQDTISISIYYDSEFEYDKNVMLAALKAVDESLPIAFNIKSSDATKLINDKADWIVWFSNKPMPEMVNTNSISYSKNTVNKELLTLSEKGWLITQHLDQENAITHNLTLQLASILLPREDVQRRANALDRRSLPEKHLGSTTFVKEKNTLVEAGTSSSMPYLLGLILLVLLTERIIAFKRNQ